MSKRSKTKDILEEYKDVTVADMNVDGMPWYRDSEQQKHDEDMESLQLTKAEEKAMIKGAYQALMPAFFIGLGVFTLAFLVLMCWFWIKNGIG